uniref:uncharacterized protein C9orf40 homolog n=1 Tax=Monopterus albus TaxID=43700 RepID=UPI0009B4523D|nr:uncharacterized protein C9orf40 homolog [Monopterus albus]
MAKRRAEDTVLDESPSKRCCRSRCSVDMQMESMSSTRAVSPPSLLALFGNRCRKRPYHFEDPEKQEAAAGLCHKPKHCDTRKPASSVLSLQTSGSFQDRGSSSARTTKKKQARKDCVGSETVVSKTNDGAEADKNPEDCSYNSFQYWRVPLPELDLSLLEDNDHSQTKDKSKIKHSSSDAMET